jgi:hypothetical protein
MGLSLQEERIRIVILIVLDAIPALGAILDNHLKGVWKTPPKRFIMGITANPITGGALWNILQESIYIQTTAT